MNDEDISGSPWRESAVDADGTVVVDVPCLRCDYNLRGLPASGRCPECGDAVSEALRGDLLRFADTDWLDKLRTGARSIGATILLAVGGFVVLMFSAASGIPGLLLLAVPGLAVLVWLAVAGIWSLTEPDPSGRGERRYARRRKYVRVAVPVTLAAGFLTVGAAPSISTARGALLASVLGFVTLAAWGSGEVAKFWYLERLAMRIPDPRLARGARSLRIGLMVCLAVMLAAWAPTSFVQDVMPFAIALGLAWWGFVALLVLQFPVLLRLSKTLKTQLELAESVRGEGGCRK